MAGNRGGTPAIKDTHGGRGSRRTTQVQNQEEAWLDAKNVKLKTLSPKLTKQRLGPFKVTKKISNQAYHLELPPTMRIHNVFYVGLLSKVKRDKRRSFENWPPPVTIDGEEDMRLKESRTWKKGTGNGSSKSNGRVRVQGKHMGAPRKLKKRQKNFRKVQKRNEKEGPQRCQGP
ncbi:Retrotransposable element Tf2 protein [Rhizoctonia solani]|uniref:Retrotransposable element Tf2 protein n=1 Tax=Rhizoctonia solani TaxID=456999 RepID=A0A8H8NVN2_9AGAM|nr:Retrotransposable element Tf2 protein [Rhizoctonia solani]QRW20365.1 Retrotransposable element Tf2 protein [Rhizoctonia solani]